MKAFTSEDVSIMEKRRIERRTSSMLKKRYTTKPYPLLMQKWWLCKYPFGIVDGAGRGRKSEDCGGGARTTWSRPQAQVQNNNKTSREDIGSSNE